MRNTLELLKYFLHVMDDDGIDLREERGKIRMGIAMLTKMKTYTAADGSANTYPEFNDDEVIPYIIGKEELEDA